jgi:membrane fusion protein, heavy metal efflux system
MKGISRRFLPFAVIAAVGVIGTLLILAKEPPAPVDEHGHAQGGHEEHEGHNEHSSTRVEMSDEVAKATGIEIKTAGIASMVVGSVYPGEVKLNQNRLAHIVPRLSGTVTQVRKNVGDPVRRGEIIAILDVTELAGLRGAFLSALSRGELARTVMVREERLWKRQIVPERNYLAAKQAYDEAQIEIRAAKEALLALGLSEQDLTHPSLTYLPVRSPIDGVVVEKHIVPGEQVHAEAPEVGGSIFKIADLSTVWVEIAVPARDLDRVSVGQDGAVVSEALGLTEEGRVAFVGPMLSEATRTAQVFVELENKDRRWKSGLFVNVRLAQSTIEVPVAIRPSGLQTLEDQSVVFVREGDAFEARPVEIGRKSEEWVEIVSGLRAGDRYAAAKSFLLKAELGKSEAGHDH